MSGVSQARYWTWTALYVVGLLLLQSAMGYAIDAFKELWGERALEVVALSIVALGAALALWIGGKAWASCTNVERSGMMLGLAVYAVGSLSARYPQERLHYLGYGVLAGLLYVGFARRSEASAVASAIYAFVAGGLIGYVDELLQILWPRRYFDWLDVGMNFVAVGLGLLVGVPAWRGWVRHGLANPMRGPGS